jgi:hypothetical protein
VTDWVIAHLPDPRKMLVFYLANLVVWTVLTPIDMLWWRESVGWINFVSMWALVLGSWGMVAAVLAEIKADPAIEIPEVTP